MIFSWADGAMKEISTLMCAHCQFQIQVHIGSHTERGWCLRCNGPTCGKQRCAEYCEPFERGLERLEGRYSLAAKMDLLATNSPRG